MSAQGLKAVPQPGREPGPLDPESSALNIRPARLPSDIDALFIVLGELCIDITAKFIKQTERSGHFKS